MAMFFKRTTVIIVWILEQGSWNDGGQWIDSSVWEDS